MSEWLRSHARLVGGALAMLLVAGLGIVLGSAGHEHAGPVSPAAETIASSSPAAAGGFVAPANSTPRRARRRTTRRAAPSPSRQSAVASTGRSGGPTGQTSPAPTSRVVALSLRRAAGVSLSQVTYRPVCARASAGHASCAAETLVLRSSGAPVRPHVAPYRSLGHVRPALAHRARAASVSASAPPAPDTPAYLQQAYDLAYLSQTGGGGDTVGIVDANDDPSAEADLATYRSTYGLPACTTANGCLRKVNQTGATSPMPAVDPSWRQETSLDLDAVSAICPLCHIVLVEANSSSFSDLQVAMQTAVALGANQISASWVGTSPSVPTAFHTFPGVATVAATGDSGYPGAGQDNYPAALPGVTAAGGTSLASSAAPGARGFSEGAWSWNGFNGAGSGCDLHYYRPSYQPAMGCAGRAYADLSADADPATGLQVYDNGGWTLIGGTSLAAPLIAAYYAITGASSATPRWAYTNSGSLNDVVGGSTGNCDAGIAYICQAGPGYDGPTGVGSISGAVVTGAPGIGGPTAGSGPGSGAGNTYTKSFGAHDATIAAGIYRNGLDTSWWIEYGTSTAYGSQTPASDIGAGSSAVAVTGYLSQLTAGTSYHYRIVAHNKLGTTYGYDNTFTTPAANTGSPMAAFAVSPGVPAPNSPVSFDASGSTAPTGASITDYSWNFGDGSTADTGATAAASHTYTTRGTYTATLTVTSNGQTDAISETVSVDTPPTAAFTPSATAVTPGSAVAFDGSASAPSLGGSITDYSWSFGDGSSRDTGTASSASHTFTSPGTYTVTLTTTDDLDVSSTVSEQVTVASFTASPAVAAPGSPVTFTVPSSNVTSGTTVSYTWDFGDGSPTVTTTSPSTTHTYSARGPYAVKLTVQTNVAGASTPDGTSSQSAATLTVDGTPSAAFASALSVATPGSSISFDAGASSAAGGSISHYRWDFGDGSSPQDTGNAASTAHTFGMPGRYTIALTVTDDLGQTATTTQQVIVDQPTAAFTVSSSTPTPGTATGFDASNSTDPESTLTGYQWDFGDGSSPQDTSATATHTYANAGTYTVKLKVTNDLGLTATTAAKVVVAPATTQSNAPSAPVTPTPAPPAPSPTPAPPASPAPRTTPAPPVASPLTAWLTVASKLRLTMALRYGLRLNLATSRSAKAGLQITIPLAQTKQAAGASRGRRNVRVVLLRKAQTFGAGAHTITLKLSRAAAGQLGVTGVLVLTVRVTLTAADGTTLTRSAKITLTR